jgi:hypothetical protein
MNILGTAQKAMGSVGRGVGKILLPTKKEKKIKPQEAKNFIQESPEEYANRLMQRRSQRH